MSGNTDDKKGFGVFASQRIIFGLVIAVGVLWLGTTVISFFRVSPDGSSRYHEVMESHPYLETADEFIEKALEHKPLPQAKEEENVIHINNDIVDTTAHEDIPEKPVYRRDSSGSSHGDVSVAPAHGETDTVESRQSSSGHTRVTESHSTPYAREGYQPRQVIGVTFVDALVAPLEAELEGRFWGWRPNDIQLFTLFMDNVENYQLGVREVTRRAADILAERIARTGSNVSFNKHLNDAVNSLTVDPKSWVWPSAESEYKSAINNLNKYKDQLLAGEESFYTRPDNLIPLLVEFRTRLGDCDDKLVRREGDKESQVSTFEADNRFYYSQGVATAILSILQAVEVDFDATLETRDGHETLHHAIESLKGAVHMEPWMVTEGDYNGVIANHRANLATYISHARFYLGILIKTLST